MSTTILMLLIFGSGLVALYHALRAVTRMGLCTREGIRWGYVAKAGGLGVILFSVVDYLLGDPYAWPEMMLFGVALSNTGTAIVHMFNRRCCD